MDEDQNLKIQKANNKLSDLLKAYALDYENKKKEGLISSSVQVMIEDNDE